MEPTVVEERASVCPRCLQSLAPDVRKCPNCRVYIPRSRLKPILLGLAGALTLIFAVLLIMTVLRSQNAESAPVNDDQEQQQPPSPPQKYTPPPLNR